jgi:hypothetical protein
MPSAEKLAKFVRGYPHRLSGDETSGAQNSLDHPLRPAFLS